MICNNSQITDDIFDFFSLKKWCSSAHGIGNIVLQKCFFYKSSLRIWSHQNTKFIIFTFFFTGNTKNAFCNKIRFVCFVFWHKNFNRFSSSISTPKFFVFAVCVMRDYTVCCFQNCSCRTIILFKSNFCNVKIMFKVYNVLIICTAPTVNALVIITNDCNIFICQKMHKLILLMTCILKFIDHDIFVTLAIFCKNFRMLFEKFYWKND